MNRPLVAAILAFGMLVGARFLPAATITVTGAGDEFPLTTPDGVVTLREAMLSIEGASDVNADVTASVTGTYGDNDTIAFGIPGTGPFVIQPVTELPPMNVAVIIDGYTQPGSSPNTQAIGNDAIVLIHLVGPSGPLGYGIKLANGVYSAIRGLVIGKFFYGVDLATSHATVEGCFIGTDTAGSTSLANENGVKVEAAAIGANTIGGALPAQRNVISGNNHYGIAMASGSSFRNPVLGNYVGLTPDGAAALPNGEYGIGIFSLQGGSVDGPDIGGPTASPGKGPGNVISGNGIGGILINSSGAGSTITTGQISGNLIGLDATGTVALGNGGGSGIDVDDVSLQGGGPFGIGQVGIGGNGAGNVISGNDRGIRVAAAQALIRGNSIGTDETGTVALPNVIGVEIDGVGAFGAGATVGSGGVGEGNVIAGNSGAGVRVHLGTAYVVGNRIGVDTNGQPLGNGGHGVEVDSANATVGGTGSDDGNVIAHQGGTGVEVIIGSPGLHNSAYAKILRNSIWDNGLAAPASQRMAINLDVGDDQTPNDPGDGDSGPNDLQNYPVIESADIVDGVLKVSGHLDSPTAGDYRVEVFSSPTCNPNGSGDGKTFLGSIGLGDGGGGSAFVAGTSTDFTNLTFPIPDGQPFISATATDNSTGATSELAPCVEATFGGSSPVPVGGEAVVNVGTAGAQEQPAIASSASGVTVVAWQSDTADGSGKGIAGRRFAAGGQALGGEFLVNQTVAGDQTAPAMAADDAGRFVVGWQGANGSGTSIYLRMYQANGSAATGEIEVASAAVGHPTVAINEAGDVLVAWHGLASSGPDASGTAILARLYAFGSPTPVTGELTVNTTTAGDQTEAAAAALDLSGDFVVAWEGPDGDGQGVYLQRLLATGSPRPGSPERLVNVTTAGDQTAPTIAASGLEPDPGDLNLYAVAWESPDGDERGIYLRRFAQGNDAPRGGEERVPELIDGDQAQPTIAVDDGLDGTVHVTAAWICGGTTSCAAPSLTAVEAIDGAPILVRGRRVGGPGRLAGPNEFTINQSLSAHTRPAIGGQANGDFFVAWESAGQDGSGETILGRRFTVQLIFRDDFESGALGAWAP